MGIGSLRGSVFSALVGVTVTRFSVPRWRFSRWLGKGCLH
jgi:hypothetical protein